MPGIAGHAGSLNEVLEVFFVCVFTPTIPTYVVGTLVIEHLS